MRTDQKKKNISSYRQEAHGTQYPMKEYGHNTETIRANLWSAEAHMSEPGSPISMSQGPLLVSGILLH